MSGEISAGLIAIDLTAAAGAAGTVGGGLATVGGIAGVLGAGVGAMGAISSANAASSAAKFNAQVASENATLANQQATTAIQAGEQQSAMSEQKTRATVGAIKAGQAAGNIEVNSGSAVDVRSSASELGELDALTVRSNAARTAFGYETQAASDTGQANLDKYQAGADTTAGELNAGSTLLGGVSSAASNYGKFLSSNSPMTP